MINYISLTDFNTLVEKLESHTKPHKHGVFVFKHSARCFISSSVKKRLEADWHLDSDQFPVFFVDVIGNRKLSQEIAAHFDVVHESPQLLFFKGTRCVGNASHNDASIETVENWINE